VVLVHVGTVEFAWKNTYTTMKAAISHYNSLIATLYHLFPHTHVIVTTLISRKSDKFNIRMKALFNHYIPTLVHKYDALGFSISMIDFMRLIPSKTLLQDGVHPNQEGYNVMGRAWAKEIRRVFGKNGHKRTGPGVVKANVAGRILEVIMSKPLRKWSVQDLSKYELMEDDPDTTRIAIMRVKLDKNMRTIMLTLSEELEEHSNYTLSMSNIMDMTVYEYTYSGSIRLSFDTFVTTSSNKTSLTQLVPYSSCRDRLGYWQNHLGKGKMCDWLDRKNRRRLNCGFKGRVVTELGRNCNWSCGNCQSSMSVSGIKRIPSNGEQSDE